MRRNAIELSHNRFAYDTDKLVAAIKSYSPANELMKTRVDSEAMLHKAEALKVVWLDLINATSSPLYKVRSKNRAFPVLGEGNADANIILHRASTGQERGGKLADRSAVLPARFWTICCGASASSARMCT